MKILETIKINVTFVLMFDMSLWLSLLCKGYKIGFCDKIVVDYRIHEEQISATKGENMLEWLLPYERSNFCKIFLTIDDINLVKKSWPDNRFVFFDDKANL